MEQYIEETIERLLTSDLTNTKISKDTGITRSVILRLRNGTQSIGNMKYENIKKLYDYQYEKEKMEESDIISYQNAMRSIGYIDDYKKKYQNLSRMNANVNMQINWLLREIENETDDEKIRLYLSRIQMFSELLKEHTREQETDLNIDRTAVFITTRKEIRKIKIGNDMIENIKFINELNEVIDNYTKVTPKQRTKRTIILDKTDIKNAKLQEALRSILDDEVYGYTEYTL
ncbi:hypothetical protein RM616_09360 [Mammaliicoccus sciuri]|uniref:hypothetical protein n=1 Tax=Mammaliicoccus sciuri TaxID=1296 RepID=UPI002886E15D|nr:hypothetical protein [Mammaliicoccus sciuri]MDT0669782.1 hypothetical protein [Mammaliicoccus sciuri]